MASATLPSASGLVGSYDGTTRATGVCAHDDLADPRRALALEAAVHVALCGSASTRPSISSPACCKCTAAGNALLACLDCVTFCCADDSHAHDHYAAAGHSLYFDFRTMSVFCQACRTYPAEKFVGFLVRHASADFKNGIAFGSHQQLKREFMLLEDKVASGATIVADQRGLIGLRGLYNLGNTCFMSVVLQSLLHNPMMRDFFLSDMHNRKNCHRSVVQDDGSAGVCIGCEMDELFQQVYTADVTPTNPHRFLYSMWQYADSLAGYEQQDAHEFCISVLDGLHSSCIISPLSAGNSANDHDRRDARVGRECPCVVHKTFAAQLRSDLTCSACAATSTAVDPILDVSLDLKRPSTLPGAASAEVGSSLLVAGAGTLVGENLIDLPVGGHGGKDIGISLSASGAASPASASPRVHLANDLALVPSLLLRASSVSGLENDSSSFLPNLEYDDENISEMVLSSHSHSHSPDLILSEMNDMAGSPVMGLPLSTTAVTIDSSDSGSSPSSTSAMGDGMPAFDAPACGGVANDGAKVAKPVAKNAGKITAGAARIALPVQTFSTSLEECLDRFTREETLHANDKIMCASCKSYQQGTKRLSFKSLPHVLCFQLKRFEHHGILKSKRMSSKIDVYVKFPIDGLDMSPYMYQNIAGSNASAERQEEVYDLFSVVVHIGSLDSGHYVCFVRRHQEWFRCDDAMVTRASVQDVLKSQGCAFA